MSYQGPPFFWWGGALSLFRGYNQCVVSLVDMVVFVVLSTHIYPIYIYIYIHIQKTNKNNYLCSYRCCCKFHEVKNVTSIRKEKKIFSEKINHLINVKCWDGNIGKMKSDVAETSFFLTLLTQTFTLILWLNLLKKWFLCRRLMTFFTTWNLF